VYLRGAYDDQTVPEIERLLRRSYGPFFFRRHLIIDLGAVTSVDESFVDFIVALVRRLHGERRELLLTRPVGGVRRSLASVGLPNLVPVYDSPDEAQAVLSTASGPLIPPRFDSRETPGSDGGATRL
jgi:anti-anti-sigma regulatory factor